MCSDIEFSREFAQFIEWNEWKALDWHLLEYDTHRGMQQFVKALNAIYQTEPCLYELDTTYDGYQWIEVDNAAESTISFERLDKKGNKLIALPKAKPGEEQERVSHLAVIHQGGGLVIIAGKRRYSLKPADLDAFQGERGRRGRLLPRGFQRVEGVEVG